MATVEIAFATALARYINYSATPTKPDFTLDSPFRGPASTLDSSNLIILLLFLEEELRASTSFATDLFSVLEADPSIVNGNQLLLAIHRDSEK